MCELSIKDLLYAPTRCKYPKDAVPYNLYMCYHYINLFRLQESMYTPGAQVSKHICIWQPSVLNCLISNSAFIWEERLIP